MSDMSDKEVTLTIEAAYGLKIPAEAQYSSQEARLGLSFEIPVNGEFDAIRDRADELQAVLAAQIKLAVFSQLGVGVVESDDGTLLPDLSAIKQEAPSKGGASKGGFTPKAAASNGGGGGGGGFQKTPRKADPSDIPTYSNVKVGSSTLDIQDLRDLKSNGTYKNTAPDFRVDGEGFWLVDKQGNMNPKAVALAEAIAPMVPFDSGDDAKTDTAVW